jgi:hypothetical protein
VAVWTRVEDSGKKLQIGPYIEAKNAGTDIAAKQSNIFLLFYTYGTF